jgi:hypothetical protein
MYTILNIQFLLEQIEDVVKFIQQEKKQTIMFLTLLFQVKFKKLKLILKILKFQFFLLQVKLRHKQFQKV